MWQQSIKTKKTITEFKNCAKFKIKIPTRLHSDVSVVVNLNSQRLFFRSSHRSCSLSQENTCVRIFLIKLQAEAYGELLLVVLVPVLAPLFNLVTFIQELYTWTKPMIQTLAVNMPNVLKMNNKDTCKTAISVILISLLYPLYIS